MNRIFRIALMLMLIPISAEAENIDTKFISEALIEAKVTGMCGALKQMAAFQETTKMKGGDDFIFRFYSTEAARLGQSLQEFLLRCESATKNYAELSKALTK